MTKDIKPLTPVELAQQVLALSEKATKGPWEAVGTHGNRWDAKVKRPDGSHIECGDGVYHPSYSKDSDLIAAYRTGAPALARHVVALEQGVLEAVGEYYRETNDAVVPAVQALRRRCDEVTDELMKQGPIQSRLESRVVALEARLTEAERLSLAFVEKIESTEKPINACIVMSDIHGAPYKGPNWSEELTALRSFLARPTERET